MIYLRFDKFGAISSRTRLFIIEHSKYSIPVTSPNTEAVVYCPHMPYKKWLDSAYGANYHDDDANTPTSSYAPPPATL